MNILTIKEIAVTAPAKLSVGISDQDVNSDTDANATLHRNRVAIKRKLSCEWGDLSWNEISTILNASSDVFFPIKYPDPKTGNFETKTFYVGDRTSPVALIKNNTVEWQGLSCDFIEQ